MFLLDSHTTITLLFLSPHTLHKHRRQRSVWASPCEACLGAIAPKRFHSRLIERRMQLSPRETFSQIGRRPSSIGRSKHGLSPGVHLLLLQLRSSSTCQSNLIVYFSCANAGPAIVAGACCRFSRGRILQRGRALRSFCSVAIHSRVAL